MYTFFYCIFLLIDFDVDLQHIPKLFIILLLDKVLPFSPYFNCFVFIWNKVTYQACFQVMQLNLFCMFCHCQTFKQLLEYYSQLCIWSQNHVLNIFHFVPQSLKYTSHCPLLLLCLQVSKRSFSIERILSQPTRICRSLSIQFKINHSNLLFNNLLTST